jgi:hypothetical protein
MNQSFEIILNDLHLQNRQEMQDEEWMELISERVMWFLENDKDLLLSYLYRLDIDESKIEHALLPEHADPPHIMLARMILDRQKKRIATKIKYKVEPIEGWEY